MPERCKLLDCSNQKGGHMFPREETLRKKWIIATKRKLWIPGPRNVICHDHFIPEDYYPNDDTMKLRRRLKPGTVPTIFPRRNLKPDWSSLHEYNIEETHDGAETERRETCRTRCCVSGCNEFGGYRFPSDPKINKIWVHAIMRAGDIPTNRWMPNNRSLVCHKHFLESDYKSRINHGLEPISRHLKKGAVPSVFARQNKPLKELQRKRGANIAKKREEARKNVGAQDVTNIEIEKHIIWFKCGVCGEVFNSYSLIQSHLEKHKKQNTHDVKESNDQNAHINDKVSAFTIKSRPYRCGLCGLALTALDKVRIHMKVHIQNGLHKCDICGKVFSQRNILDLHRKTHTESKTKQPLAELKTKQTHDAEPKTQEVNNVANVHETNSGRLVCQVLVKSQLENEDVQRQELGSLQENDKFTYITVKNEPVDHGNSGQGMKRSLGCTDNGKIQENYSSPGVVVKSEHVEDLGNDYMMQVLQGCKDFSQVAIKSEPVTDNGCSQGTVTFDTEESRESNLMIKNESDGDQINRGEHIGIFNNYLGNIIVEGTDKNSCEMHNSFPMTGIKTEKS